VWRTGGSVLDTAAGMSKVSSIDASPHGSVAWLRMPGCIHPASTSPASLSTLRWRFRQVRRRC
jgi:hypothetical protein